MPEDEVEVGQETGGETVEVETQPPVKEGEKKPKSAKAAAAKPSAAPEAEEKVPGAEETVVAEAEVEKPEAEPEAAPEAEEKKPAAEKPAPAKAEKRAPIIDDIMAKIKKMTVLELSQLVKVLEDEFGVSAAAPVVAAPAAPIGGAAAPTGGAAPAAAEEKTEFSVILKDIGANKISVIKAVRELTTLGLKESKDLVESAPKPVKEGINKDEATVAKQKLEEAGATAEIT